MIPQGSSNVNNDFHKYTGKYNGNLYSEMPELDRLVCINN